MPLTNRYVVAFPGQRNTREQSARQMFGAEQQYASIAFDREEVDTRYHSCKLQVERYLLRSLSLASRTNSIHSRKSPPLSLSTF